jgi:hypothetical protein
MTMVNIGLPVFAMMHARTVSRDRPMPLRRPLIALGFAFILLGNLENSQAADLASRAHHARCGSHTTPPCRPVEVVHGRRIVDVGMAASPGVVGFPGRGCNVTYCGYADPPPLIMPAANRYPPAAYSVASTCGYVWREVWVQGWGLSVRQRWECGFDPLPY